MPPLVTRASTELPFETTPHIRDRCLCLQLQRAARVISRCFDDALRPLNLTNGQFSLLISLNRPQPARMGSVAALLGAYTPFYSTYGGSKAAVEHFTRAASKELGTRGISVNAVGPGPMDTPFFYGQEDEDAVAYHSSAAALSPFTKTGLTHIKDIVPLVRFLVSDGWWITGQTILANGGYTTK